MSQRSEDRSKRELQSEIEDLRRDLRSAENSANFGAFVAGFSLILCATTTCLYLTEKNSPATPVDNNDGTVRLYIDDPALAATAQSVFYTHQKALRAPYIPDTISQTQLLLAEEDPSIELMVTNAIINGIEQHISQVNLLSEQLLDPLEAELERHQIRYGQLLTTLGYTAQNNSSEHLAWWMPPERDKENPVFAIEQYVLKAIFGNQYERA